MASWKSNAVQSSQGESCMRMNVANSFSSMYDKGTQRLLQVFTTSKDPNSNMMETTVYTVQGPHCRQSINNRYKHGGGRQVSNSGRDNTVAHGQLNSQHLL